MSESTHPQPPARHPTAGTRPTEPEQLPCPRCDSTNTKFCYYNNYNLSQPRHFCKSCRRYWTRGGTLRNVPVGGGTRKTSSNKRSRTTTTTPSSCSSTVSFDPLPGNPVSALPGSKPEMDQSRVSDPGSGCSSVFGEVNLNEMGPGPGFTTLLGSQHWDGFGLGLGSGLNGMGFGISGWDNLPAEQGGEGNAGGCGGVSGGATWQVGGVEGGLSDGDCFGWPDLSISTPGKSLK